jgi:RNA polymerase sigma factor (TIGR02999 family)
VRDARAANETLLQLAYAELRAVAERLVRQSGDVARITPSSLLHLASMKLLDQRTPFADARHLTGVAILAMRRLLVDLSRSRQAQKRDGGVVVSLDAVPETEIAREFADPVVLDEALGLLAQAHPRPARVVEARTFGGLSVEETGELLGLSAAQVKRDWSLGIEWLRAHWRADGGRPRN